MFVDNNDDLDISNQEVISENNFYDAVDMIVKKQQKYQDNEMFELGVDEGYFANHVEQIQIPFNYYFYNITPGTIVGSKLFRKIHKFELLEQILNEKYVYLRVYKDKFYSKPYQFNEKIVELSDYLIQKDIDDCLSIIAADYFLCNTLLTDDLEIFRQIALDKYMKDKKIPDSLKKQVGIDYINLRIKGIQEYQQSQIASNTKYYKLSNEIVDIIFNQLGKQSQQIVDSRNQNVIEQLITIYNKHKYFFLILWYFLIKIVFFILMVPLFEI